MKRVYEEDKNFTGKQFAKHGLPVGEYEGCTFADCDFSGADLSSVQFFACRLERCNLSNALMKQTVLREVNFVHCKLTGIRFDDCNPFLFSPTFEDCVLQYASFYQLKMKQCRFVRCNAAEVDFTEADLTEAVFDATNLTQAVFEQTNLQKADLRTAFNYRINPSTNRVQKAKFAWPQLKGLLGELGIDMEE
jgi:fluoroquinolone resistance protein